MFFFFLNEQMKAWYTNANNQHTKRKGTKKKKEVTFK